MEKIYQAFYQADEIKTGAYGEGFYGDMLEAHKSGKITEADVVLVVNTLVAVDEIRDVFAGEIQELIFAQIKSQASMVETCDFLKEICNFYNGEYIEEEVITKIFDEVHEKTISLADGIKRMHAIFA